MKNKIKYFLLIFLTVSIFYIIITVFIQDGFYLDTIVFNKNNVYFTFFRIITKLGNWYSLLAITLASFILKDKKYFKYISLNLSLLVIISQTLKLLFQRVRPELNLIGASGFSFPSGHAMVSMGFYGFILYLIVISNINKKAKLIFSCIIEIVILLIGFSRIYLGAHYFTDVIAGFILSAIYLIIYIDLLKIGDK